MCWCLLIIEFIATFDLQSKNKLGADAIQISVRCEIQQSVYYKQVPYYKKFTTEAPKRRIYILLGYNSIGFW
jgi:hypothetical protein